MREKNKTPSLRLKPLVACLAMSMAVASTGSLVAPELAHAASTRPAAKLASVKVSQAHRAEALAQVREYRHIVRGKGNLQARTDRPAATVLVTSCDDDGSAGTLRAVVESAVDGDTVDLSALTCSQITLTSGEIEIAAPNLTIQGPGAKSLSIDAGGSNRAFYHDPGPDADGGTLTLADVTVTNGYYFDDYLIAPGGCILSFGSVTLSGAAVTNCKAVGKYSSGGAINAADDITLTNSTVSGNQSLGNASKYGDPQPGGDGGGLYAGGNVTISKSTISNNRAELTSGAPPFNRGGGVLAFGAITVIDSAIVNNEAVGNGSGGIGGGVFAAADDSTVTITNSTISGNNASMAGGGIVSFSPLDLANSTVSFNSAGKTGIGGGGIVLQHDAGSGPSTFNSSLVAKNTGAGSSYDADLGSYAGGVVGANNLIIAASGEDLPADTLSDDPMLLPLADNGGPTLTHALAAGSPATDAGNNLGGLEFDQRGEPHAREVGKAADIGAFESAGDDLDIVFRNGFD